MSSPPEDDAARVAAVRSTGFLDGPADEAIDALARVASSVCGTPIALVALVDADRLFFVANVGLPTVSEVPREAAFCAHAILQREVIEVPDVLLDGRFDDHPLVKGEPHVRFYAAMPLIDRDGFALGTICVIDHVPRKLTPLQSSVLRELSTAVVKLLEERRADVGRKAAKKEALEAAALHGFVAVATDITDLASALRQSERQNALLRLGEDVAELGHWRIELATERLYWSEQVYRIHGLEPATFTPTVASAIAAYHPDDRERVAAYVALAIERREPFAFELRIVRPDGEIRTVLSRGRIEVDPRTGATQSVFGVFQDVTERERLRERIVRQERLVTTGTLAAGVGHEINNPLTYVAANIELALTDLGVLAARSPQPALREVLEVLGEAREGAERIRKIVHGLRAFAREQAVAGPTDVHGAIDIAVDMAMHELRHRATLVTKRGDVPLAFADESRLSQVFVNLIVNASEAFPTADPEANVITVTTEKVADGRIAISIADNGPGIRHDVLPRIFDPFFTTKPVGKGTGLGLAISHSVVASLGGELTCATEVGKGTTFRVLLPPATPPNKSSLARANVPQRGRVLVVDDDSPVLRAMTRLLNAEHDVTALEDGREALRRVVEDAVSYDVVFCDLMMPLMTGMDLYRRIREVQPSLAERFVFVSGGTITDEARTFLASIPNERLLKPFNNQSLRALARRFVDQRPTTFA